MCVRALILKLVPLLLLQLHQMPFFQNSFFFFFDQFRIVIKLEHLHQTFAKQKKRGDSGILSLILKKNWQYAPICELYRDMSLFRYSITLKSSSIKYPICKKSSYTRSNFKKKKFAWNSTFRKSSSRQKKIYKCDCPLYRESYSGVFKPYSDILKPYSGVFLQNFL